MLAAAVHHDSPMRQFLSMILLICGVSLAARPAAANCFVLAQVDQMHQLQLGLLHDADTPFFRDDVRRLRTLAGGLSTPQILRAVDGGNWTGHGADFRRFLANTLVLLDMASLDDPASVKPHFSAPVRANLQRVGSHIAGLRCTPDQIMAARDALLAANQTSPLPPPVPPALFWSAILLLLIWGARQLLRLRIVRHRRRSTRHPLRYSTRGWWDDNIEPITLLDINRTGTRLRHRSGRPLPKGAQVDLDIQRKWTKGIIVWSDEESSGVLFQDRLTFGKVNRLRQEDAPQKRQRQKQNGAPKDAIS